MPLPNPGWNVVYGEIPAASKWSQLGANDDALAAGTGLNDLAITTAKLAMSAADHTKIKPQIINGDSTATVRFTTTSNSFVDVPGLDVVYTAPANCAMRIFLIPTVFITAGSSAAYSRITANGVKVDNSESYHVGSSVQVVSRPCFVDVAAGQTVTLRVQAKSDAGSMGVVNEGTGAAVDHHSRITGIVFSNQ